MRRWLLGLVLGVGVFVIGGGRPAQACGSGNSDIYTGLLVAVVAVGAADVGFTIADLTTKWLPPAYGVAEMLITAPQAVLFG